MIEPGIDQNQPQRPPQPGAKTPYDRILLFIGSLAGIGFVPVASGTVSVAVVGVPLAILLLRVFQMGWPAYLALVVAFTLVSVWIAGEADRVLHEKDSKKNVIDEIPGYLIALMFLPATWQILTAAFFIERVIDIAKVPPANWIERRCPGGWGVVLDDVVAGIYTCIFIHGAVTFFPSILGVPS